MSSTNRQFSYIYMKSHIYEVKKSHICDFFYKGKIFLVEDRHILLTAVYLLPSSRFNNNLLAAFLIPINQLFVIIVIQESKKRPKLATGCTIATVAYRICSVAGGVPLHLPLHLSKENNRHLTACSMNSSRHVANRLINRLGSCININTCR